MSAITRNLSEVKARIADAAVRSGRDPASVTLVAVSKVHPADAIREAYTAGQRHFGESYAQELRAKLPALADLSDITWHFIGHLQRNKAKYVVPAGGVVETVDSERLIGELDRLAERAGRVQRVLIQVNVGEETQKSGVSRDALPRMLDAAAAAVHVEAIGLMTIPPWDLDAEETRRHFIALRELRERTGGERVLPHLSMGMSHDFEVAVEEGATLVRVGTAIFGDR